MIDESNHYHSITTIYTHLHYIFTRESTCQPGGIAISTMNPSKRIHTLYLPYNYPYAMYAPGSYSLGAIAATPALSMPSGRRAASSPVQRGSAYVPSPSRSSRGGNAYASRSTRGGTVRSARGGLGAPSFRATSSAYPPVGTVIIDHDAPLVGPDVPLYTATGELAAVATPVYPPTTEEFTTTTTTTTVTGGECVVSGIHLYYPYGDADYFTIALYDPATVDGKSIVYWLLLNVPQVDVEAGYPYIPQEQPPLDEDSMFVVDVYKQPTYVDVDDSMRPSRREIDLIGFVRDNGLALVARGTLNGSDAERYGAF